MPLTPDEFAEACRETCPVCKAGRVARYREDTQEWVHDYTVGSGYSHAFCLASGLRKFYAAQSEGKS